MKNSILALSALVFLGACSTGDNLGIAGDDLSIKLEPNTPEGIAFIDRFNAKKYFTITNKYFPTNSNSVAFTMNTEGELHPTPTSPPFDSLKIFSAKGDQFIMVGQVNLDSDTPNPATFKAYWGFTTERSDLLKMGVKDTSPLDVDNPTPEQFDQFFDINNINWDSTTSTPGKEKEATVIGKTK